MWAEITDIPFLKQIAAGHYETEFPAVVSLCKLLEDKFKDIQFKVAEQKTPIKNI